MNNSFFLFLLLLQPVNPDAALVSQFLDHVNEYVKSTAQLKSSLPSLKPTDSRESVTMRSAELAVEIEKTRAKASQGAFFTQPVAAEFRRLIGITLQGNRARHIEKSLADAEPVEAQMQVNKPYPAIPLQSMPPSLLANLPNLPPEVDYRIVGHSLVLRDVQANLVLDFLPRAIP